MRLHYNNKCAHKDDAITPLRLLYARGRFSEAQQEIVRLGNILLTDYEYVVASFYRTLVDLLQEEILYGQAQARLTMLAYRLKSLVSDDNFTAALQARLIGVAAHYSDRGRVRDMLAGFFKGINRTPTTIACFRFARAERIRHYNPGKVTTATPFYMRAFTALEFADAPCQKEMISRRLACQLCEAGRVAEALDILWAANLPVSSKPDPEPGKLPLKDLLTIPLM